MKTIHFNIIVIIATIFFCTFLISCQKDDEFQPKTINPPSVTDEEGTQDTAANNENPEITLNKHANSWINESMKEYYLWNDEIPVSDSTINPAGFFKSLLYMYGNINGDRFSQIVALSGTKSVSASTVKSGYDFVLLGIANSSNIYAYINYVDKGSPAEKVGLKRGDLFLKINGVQLTRNNYINLIQQINSQHALTMATASGGSLVVGNNIVVPVGYYSENPIFLDTVYKINNKSIGYLVYNSFTPDDGDGTRNFDKQLNNIFGKFKSQGVTELVLDFRYNGGGALSSAVNFASMIVGTSEVNQVFTQRTYNNSLHDAYIKEYGTEYVIDRFTSQMTTGDYINHLGIKKLYVLVSYRTASASEVIINGLRPYVDVVLIGGNRTVGKNVGSIAINANDNKITWQLQPIVVRISNSTGFSDYVNGFAPDIVQNEYDIENPKPLGDVGELLLSQAITHITGQSVSKLQTDINNTVQPIASTADMYPEKQITYLEGSLPAIN